MEYNLQIFINDKFGKIRTLNEEGKILFCASDIAKSLGYASPKDAITRHCKGALIRSLPTSGGVQDMKFIPEGDIYRLVIKSSLPGASEFESWIFDEVLPTIRNYGLYAVDDLINDPDLAIRAFTALKEEREKRKELEQKFEEQKPLVEFAETVGSTKDLITMSQMAKLVHDEHIPLGRNKLFEWLRNKGYLRPNNEPYQAYIDRGYFKVKEGIKETAYGPKTYTQTYVTGKGQIYIVEKLRQEFCSDKESA